MRAATHAIVEPT